MVRRSSNYVPNHNNRICSAMKTDIFLKSNHIYRSIIRNPIRRKEYCSILAFFNPVEGTDSLFRNIGKKLPLLAA